MPAVNDLTPEEEALFGQHGVQSAGPGREPTGEASEGQQNQQQTQDDEPEPEIVTEDGQGEFSQQQAQQQTQQDGEPKPGELGSRHRADGTFKNKDELEADRQELERLALSQGQGGQQQQGQQQPRFVPHEALHAERVRAAQATRMAQLATTRLNALLAQQQGRGQDEVPQMPNLQEDPAGYIVALEQRLAAFENARAEETQYRQLDSALEQDEALFAATVPDYDTASDYYVQSRARELLAFHTPQDAQRIMTQEARQIANQAWQRGMSAAQVIYGLAQARGYQLGQGQQQQQGGGQAQQLSQGGQQRQQQQGGGQAQVAAIRQRQGQRSLGAGVGGGSAQQLNAESVLNMSDDEFEEYLKLGEKGANARFAALG